MTVKDLKEFLETMPDELDIRISVPDFNFDYEDFYILQTSEVLIIQVRSI